MPETRYEGVPLSDDTGKLDEPLTREQCIAELRRVAELDTTVAMTRNYFRNMSHYREVVWNRHFGTFLEFKRGSGIILSRHAHRMERDVAKHSAVSAFKAMNAEKRGYEEKYLRPANRRFQALIHITDVHDIECDPFWRRVLMETVARIQPEKVIIGGDLFDLPEFSKYGVDPREWDVVGRIKFALAFLRELREAAPNAELIFIEGNHEYRLLRHLAEETPALRAVLSDLHGFTIPKLLGLDEFEINYVSRSDLATFTKRDMTEEVNRNWHISWDCYLSHHFPEGRNMGFPGAHGHHHSHWVTQHYSPTFRTFEWQQLGCGHRRLASYCAGEKWSMGFNVCHVDTRKKFTLNEYVTVTDMAMVGGRFYERGAKER